MDLFNVIFGNLFRSKKQAYLQRARADVHRNTIGRVNGRMMQASANVDKAVYGAQKKASAKAFGKRSGPAHPGPQASAATPAQGQGQANAPKGGKGQARVPNGGKGQGKMGLFGSGNKNQGGEQQTHQGPYCSNGHPVDPSWDVCPACIQMGLVQPQGMSPQGQPQGMANYSAEDQRTQAIDVRGLENETRRSVVGWIVAQNGNHRGMDFRLFDGKNVIGTAADCDIVITDPFLSARHCTVRCENGNFVVIDLDSKNGTYVNQKRASKEELIDNDTVRLGKTEFKFKSLY